MKHFYPFSTETRFSDIPLSRLPPQTSQKSVQWDTREPIKILEEREADRSDSRYGSHGSIDTILRKQWIENRTETLAQTTSPTNQRLSVQGSIHSPIDNSSVEPTALLTLKRQDSEAIDEGKQVRRVEERVVESAYGKASVIN